MNEWTYPRIAHPLDDRPSEDPEWLALAREYANMPRDAFIEMCSDASPADYREMLRLRFRFDLEWFLRYFWPDTYGLPFNRFQRHFLSRERLFWRDRARALQSSTLLATAAPRGNAKTTLGKGLMVHDACYGLEGYTVVISAGVKDGSEPIVKDVIEMATTCIELHEVYGTITWHRHAERRALKVGDNHQVAYYARSFKVQVRGTNFRNQRPTKFVVDDGEHPERVKNPKNRAADDQFLKEDILKAGPPRGGLLVDWVGTVLHRDALLPNILNDTAWRGQKWRAIEVWNEDPTNAALWRECQLLWADKADEDRENTAYAFYCQNKDVMDEGWEVMDPSNWPLYKLQVAIWSEGLASFLKERQNEVSLSQYAFFDTKTFSYFDIQTDPESGREYVELHSSKFGVRRSYIEDFVSIIGYLDPVPGKDLGSMHEGAGAGDYASFAVLGKDRFGYVYVLDSWLARDRDSAQLDKVWELAEKWKLKNVAVETNNFARLITRDFRKSQALRKEEGLYWNVRFHDDHVQMSKEDRIAALQPVTANGWLRFNSAFMNEKTHPYGHILLEQFMDFPNGAHDDGPDAVASAFKKIGGTARLRTTRALNA